MKFERKLSVEGRKPVDLIQWKTLRLKLAPGDAEPIVVEVPAEWTDTAAQIIVTKYFRKAGVPNIAGARLLDDMPQWIKPSKPWTDHPDYKVGSETSAKQLFHRLAGALTYHGWKMGLFNIDEEVVDTYPKPGARLTYRTDRSEQNARIFYDELYLILARQLAAPNSPQWFNTGLWWAYGIEGPASGQWAVDYTKFTRGYKAEECVYETSNAYEYPQPHACFIQPVEDDLVNPGGIMDLWTREVRLFKQGSGTGSNFSTLRAKGEPLSGGGVSSGMMSFLDIGDRAAGAISSGGVTRRAAKMVVVDADHPEIEDFVAWKAREEAKAAAMWIGSMMATKQDRWLLPQELINRVGDHMPTEVFSIDYEGEAIRTVGGQNSNNSVRVLDQFMEKLSAPKGTLWYLKERTTGKLVKSIQARDLWDKILRAAWASADPGLQFHDTINRYHTCKADGEIRASNPCSEYMFLDNTACNLASLNLAKFYVLKNLADPTSHRFDVDLFCHVARLMTVVLDISVSMASFPSKEIALGSYNYRTLGLGYANLGGLLMRMGLPYDSSEGRAIASSITALMTAEAFLVSQSLADELGAFPRWRENARSVAEVIELHYDASTTLSAESEIGLAARKKWEAIYVRRTDPIRNAQVTLLAPTGTIGLLMDCDTLGIEPDFSLIKHKSLAGGGTMVLVNQAVEQALVKLGYNGTKRNLIIAYIKQHGTVENCPDPQSEHLPVFDCATPPQGFSRSIAPMGHVNMMAAVQPFLSGAISKTVNMPNSATVEDVGEVYMAAWKLGLKAIAIYRDGSKLAQPLQGGTQKEPETKKSPVREKDGVVTIENISPGLTMEFPGKIVPNFPLVDNGEIDFGLGLGYFATEEMEDLTTKVEVLTHILNDSSPARGQREYLPWRRQGPIQKIKIGPEGQSVILTLGLYPDGRLGELYVELSRTGPTLHAFGQLIGMLVSIGLQYGVPVEEYVKRLSGRKFEPAGLVEGHDNIKYASSIADLIARELGLTFLGRKEMGQVQPKSEVEPEDVGVPIPVEYGQNRQSVNIQQDRLDICPKCGEHSLTQNGSCHQCLNGECGFNDGCGG